MPFLSRDSILEVNDLKTERVHIPEWGGDVLVRTLTAKERDEFENSMVKVSGRGRSQVRELIIQNVRARLAVLTVLNEDGEQMFNRTDEEALGKKAGSALNRIWDVSSRLAGISDSDVEEILGNSETDPDDSLPSD